MTTPNAPQQRDLPYNAVLARDFGCYTVLNAEKRRVEEALEKAQQVNRANAEKRRAMGLPMPSHLEDSLEKARQAKGAGPSKLQRQ